MTDLLGALAIKAVRDPYFLGFALAEYARTEELSDESLAAELGCSPENLTMLRLCRAPRPEPNEFRRDIEQVATRFGADAGRLAAVIRRIEGTIRLRNAGQATADLGYFLAARDADATEDDS
jgi:hypothetical protein